MTKRELAEYAGCHIYVRSKRMGSVTSDHDLHCLARYQITERGTLVWREEVMPLTDDRKDYEEMMLLTDGGKYLEGRPSAQRLTRELVEELIKPLINHPITGKLLTPERLRIRKMQKECKERKKREREQRERNKDILENFTLRD